MKHIFLNLKRFDVPKEYGGVNAIAAVKDWGSYIVEQTQKGLMEYGTEDVEFAMFFPEAHILTAAGTLCEGSPVKVGCQGVFRQDTAVGGNFGAFTTSRTANAARALGCSYVLIGHCEERKDKAGILAAGGGAAVGGNFGAFTTSRTANAARALGCSYVLIGHCEERKDKAGILAAGGGAPAAVNGILNQEIREAVRAGLKVLYCIGETSEEQRKDKAGILAAGGGAPAAVNGILNQEIREAVRAGLKVLYCIGETSEEQPRWQEVLRTQLEEGLKDVDKSCVTIAYEPQVAGGFKDAAGGGIKGCGQELRNHCI